MRTLMTQPITRREVTGIRQAVARHASGCGLAGPRLEDFVLAVHESVINVVTHAGGHGTLRLWTADGVLRAETADHGSGIPHRYTEGRKPPETASTGRGIFLIKRLCDDVDFHTGPAGTTVELAMRLPGRPCRPGSPMKRIRVAAGHCRVRFTA
ncbi:ATP-binding protein [Nonomuraea sp. SBT364]|uniref:ATP-binding protein n=1 Tax=Nonomuraea sp. SBT364 TaxID=1580530 RepID=UPI00069E1BB2|nr:ATP-binding protein [Nonomuraea sp. SBT364]